MRHDTFDSGVFVLHERAARMQPHGEVTHTEHGLTFLVDGWIRIEHGTELRIPPGSVCIMPAGVPHRQLAGEGVEYWLGGFCATCLALDESQLLMSPFQAVRHGALPIVEIPEERRPFLVGLFGALREESERGLPESPELSRSLLLLILGEVRRAMAAPEQAHVGDSLVAQALAFIQQHALTPISLRDVAAAVFRTPAHVATSVKAATGYSVGEWINSGRTAEAAKRLVHTDESLEEIANHVGWRDKTHFIRQFRSAYGVTPAAWRKQQRDVHRPQR